MSLPNLAEAREAMRAMWAEQDDWACRFPELHLRVWASPRGMEVRGLLYNPGPRFGRQVHAIAKATWQPGEVTERRVVDWGRRALAAWLENELEGVEDGDIRG